MYKYVSCILNKILDLVDKMKIRIKFEGIEPILCIQIKSERTTKNYEYGLFYPFRRMKVGYYNFKIYCRYKKLNYPTIKCQGCGGGYAEWSIREPNGQDCRINVCKHCVIFYDVFWSKKRLETDWLLEVEKI